MSTDRDIDFEFEVRDEIIECARQYVAQVRNGRMDGIKSAQRQLCEAVDAYYDWIERDGG